MSVCAVVDLNSNVVVNMIVAEVSDLAPEGTRLIEVTPDMAGHIGWTWDGTKFIDPNPPSTDITSE
jgi:hypothetical protein